MSQPGVIRQFLYALVAIAGCLVLLVVFDDVSTAGTTVRVNPIDTENRAAVATSYQKHVAENIQLTAGWNGSTDSCDAGAATADYTRATIATINWFRAMAGLRNVSEDRSDSQAAQQAALMMDAANSLSHAPNDSWACHSESGAGAAGRSNLTLGIAGPRGVIGQIEDAGPGNAALGHRRWLLYPELAQVGVGNTNRASAVQVIGNFDGDRSGNAWVAWPPAGYVPGEVVFDRWSIAYNGGSNADFSNATVSMTKDGGPIGLNVLRSTDGFGDATLAWEPAVATSDVGSDTPYRVTISNIVVDGQSRSHSYDVVVFDAGSVNSSASSTGRPMCHGMPATIVGTSGADTVRGTSGPDVIVTFGGNDRIFGHGGNDQICAGPGNDVINGGPGNDLISGGRGRDRIRGAAGTDSCWAQSQSKRSARNDRLRSCERQG